MKESDIYTANKRNRIALQGKSGIRISLYTGMLEQGFPDRWSTLHFYHAFPGDRIHISDSRYEYAIATYSLEREDTWLYTYSYQKEENWSTYNKDLTPQSYRQEDYIFAVECYFKVNLRQCDGKAFAEEQEELNKKVEFLSEGAPYKEKEFFREEISKTVEEAKVFIDYQESPTMGFLLLTDSHYVVNGTWDDTVHNMTAVAEQMKLDGIIHLGDLTDGMVSREVTTDYVNKMMEDMRSIGLPLYLILGNHDSNYFANNPERFTEEEQYELYLKEINKQDTKLYYYIDMEWIRVRFIFLDSFDYREKVRYGFSDDEVVWFQSVLKETPSEYRVLIFSHVPPLAEIHYWSYEIRNGDQMMELAEEYAGTASGKVLGWIHGHNHAEQVYRKRLFPIISLGCNKCEYFPDKKPEGAVARRRYQNDVTQDLWDILILQSDTDSLKFIRFGAGESYHVDNG